METKPSLVIARKVFLEYLGINKFPNHKVLLNSFEVVQMIADGIERAVAENTPTSDKQLATPDVSVELPNNLALYRNARAMDYPEYCKWINARLGN